MKMPKFSPLLYQLTLILILAGFLVQTAIGDPRWEFANPLPAADNIVSLDFVDASTGWMVTEGGRLKCSDDGGRTWRSIDLPDPSACAKGVDFVTPNVGWVLGGTDLDSPWLERIYWTSNGGADWGVWLVGEQNQACALNSLNCAALDQGWACGSAQVEGVTRPAFYRYEGADEWAAVVLPEGFGVALKQVKSIARGHLCAVGAQGYAAVSADDGDNWELVNSGTNLDLFDISFPSPAAGFMVGGDFRRGVIMRSRDGGGSWSALPGHPAQSRIVRIKADNANSVVAVSEGWADFPGMVIKTRDGQNWETLLSCEHRLLTAFAAFENTLWVGGSDGYLTSSPNAVEWTCLSRNLFPGGANAVCFIDHSTGWCAGGPGGILRTTNGGLRWRSVVVEADAIGLAIAFSDSANGWLALEGSVEMRTQDGGRSWNQAEIAHGDVHQIVFSGPKGYAIHGLSVAVTDDGGENWRSVEVIRGVQTNASSLSVLNPEVAYIASYGDSLRRTTDGGQNWQALSGVPFATAYAVSFFNAEQGWVAGANDQGNLRVYGTTDGGSHWTGMARLDFIPDGIYFSNADQGYLWAASGLVWTTQDGGRHWEDMYLKAASDVRDLTAMEDGSVWICGSRGLLARYGEPRLDVGDSSPSFPSGLKLMNVWPNPTNGWVNISFAADRTTQREAALYDIFGRRVTVFQPNIPAPGTFLYGLSLSDYPAGVYWLTLNRGSEMKVVKISLIK
ncbi:MAG: YCF48-related protein [Calditrichota bacterium]